MWLTNTVESLLPALYKKYPAWERGLTTSVENADIQASL